MLDSYKITTTIAAAIAIAAFVIGGVVWAVGLHGDVRDLQSDVRDLHVAEMRKDIAEIKESSGFSSTSTLQYRPPGAYPRRRGTRPDTAGTQ